MESGNLFSGSLIPPPYHNMHANYKSMPTPRKTRNNIYLLGVSPPRLSFSWGAFMPLPPLLPLCQTLIPLPPGPSWMLSSTCICFENLILLGSTTTFGGRLTAVQPSSLNPAPPTGVVGAVFRPGREQKKCFARNSIQFINLKDALYKTSNSTVQTKIKLQNTCNTRESSVRRNIGIILDAPLFMHNNWNAFLGIPGGPRNAFQFGTLYQNTLGMTRLVYHVLNHL